MTSSYLLLWIALGIVLQLLIYLSIVFWRKWMDFRAMPERRVELSVHVRQNNLNYDDRNAVSAWSGYRTFQVCRKVAEDSVKSIYSFYLLPVDGQPLAPFLPGQFLTFRLNIPSGSGADEKVVRCYSLSDATYTDGYRVSIKKILSPSGIDVPPGRASNYFHEQIKVGSLLDVLAPSGHFCIDKSETPMVLVGGGIGITPMLSMLNWSLTNQSGREIWLFYGVRNSQELMMKGHLEALALTHANFHLWICFSNPLPEDLLRLDNHHPGHVDVNLLRAQLPLKLYHFYVCGPTPMMESLIPALDDWGVPYSHIHFETFGPDSIKRHYAVNPLSLKDAVIADSDISVKFTLSSKQFSWQSSGNNLLEFAESNGIAVNYGCRVGSCGTCQTTISSGEVTYSKHPDFDPAPGTCLLCISKPKTNLTLEL